MNRIENVQGGARMAGLAGLDGTLDERLLVREVLRGGRASQLSGS